MSNVVYLEAVKTKPRGGIMDAQCFRIDIIRPVLQIVSLWSPSAENLLLGTALTESNLQIVKQINGQALSFYQIELATYMDVLRYINLKNGSFKEHLLTACFLETWPGPDALMWHMRLATIIARVKYLMSPLPLPAHDDALGMYELYKKVYNTSLGKANTTHAMPYFREACAK